MSWFRRHYGAGPGHLVGLLACFAVAAYAVSRVATVPHHWQIGLYFAVALVAHDFILFPLYSLADRVLRIGARLRARPAPAVPWVNHVRVPVVMSAVLLMVSFPIVLRLAPDTYRGATGLGPDPFLGRWLVVSAVLFGVSGAWYALRVLRARRSRPTTGR